MATDSVGNWQIAHVPEPERYFLYATAYLSAAEAVCRRMLEDEEARNWPSASVALMLGAHSLELFLKGAIFRKEPQADVGHHRLWQLHERYLQLYPEPCFFFESPFRTEFVGFSEAEIETLRMSQPVPSIVYRYPVAKPGTEWKGIHSFEPRGFLSTLNKLSADYDRFKVSDRADR